MHKLSASMLVVCLSVACGSSSNGSRTQNNAGAAGDLGNAGAAGTAGAAGGAGVTAGSSAQTQDAGTDSGDQSNAGAPASGCTAAQLQVACAGFTCGAAPSCGIDCGTCPADEACSEGICAPLKCSDLDFTVETYASCAITTAPGTELDGEGFIDAMGTQQRVLAMDRWGKGHVMAWCDSSSLSVLLKNANARGYLGRRNDARIASFGDDFQCNPASPSSYPVPSYITYFGKSLPDEYLGHPEKLKQDWDGIIFCGFRAEWNDGWTSLLQDYVSEQGGGLLAVLDYISIDVTHDDFVHMAGITEPAGLSYEEVVLDMSTATATVASQCVPDYVPAPE